MTETTSASSQPSRTIRMVSLQPASHGTIIYDWSPVPTFMSIYVRAYTRSKLPRGWPPEGSHSILLLLGISRVSFDWKPYSG